MEIDIDKILEGVGKRALTDSLRREARDQLQETLFKEVQKATRAYIKKHKDWIAEQIHELLDEKIEAVLEDYVDKRAKDMAREFGSSGDMIRITRPDRCGL